MKRFIAWILVFVFAIGLLGCRTAQQNDRKTEGTTDNTAGTAANAEQEPVQDAVEDADTLFTFGTVNGDSYESPFLGYGVKLENWTFADQKRLAEVNNWNEQFLSTDVQELINQSEMFTEMLAESEDGTLTVSAVILSESFAQEAIQIVRYPDSDEMLFRVDGMDEEFRVNVVSNASAASALEKISNALSTVSEDG